MSPAFRLLFGALVTKGRLAVLGALAVIPVVLGLALRAGDGDPLKGAHDALVQAYGMGLLVPVVSLVFASAVFGDAVDDRTLVYLWLKPVARWKIVLAGLGAALLVALPLSVVPIAVGVSVSGAGTDLVRGAVFGTALAVIAYSTLFLGLGLKARRALVWGLAYVLIWEGAVARVARGAARLSVSVHARSVVARVADLELPRNATAMTTAIVVPIVISVLAVALTVWWLSRTDVA